MKATLLSACINTTVTASGLKGQTTEAHFAITFLGQRGVRVQVSLLPDFEQNPYSLVAEVADMAKTHGFVLKDQTAERLVWASAQAQFVVQLSPFRCSLLDGQGHVLCADEAGLGTAVQGTALSVYKELQSDERFVGLGEKTGPLNRRGHAYTNWNTDAFGYGDGNDPIYLSTPFYMGLHAHGAYGFFLVNSYKSHFNFGASTNRFSSITVEAGCLDYILIAGPEPADVISFYTLLTGRTPLPPRWALGLQQCRYSYSPDYEVQLLAATYRHKRIPADVIYLDIHYMDAYKVFTWHPDNFSHPQHLLAGLAADGFKTVVILDPGIKVEQGYAPYEAGLEGNHFVRYPDGEHYQGQVWPGWCHFPDFTRPATRSWWGSYLYRLADEGISGYWTDMNEPATWGQRIPDILEFDLEGRGGSHLEAHNLYGLTMAKATAEGAAQARPNKRPFVLTRAGFSGVQRYAAVWTGDNRAEDSHMLLGTRLLNSMGLAGVGFCGTDIGGFVGDGSPELFARWLTVGAFSPLCRIHSMIDSRNSEPWSYGEKVEAIARNYINLRYRLMPYYYSLFKQMEETGLPVQRSLVLTDGQHPKTYQCTYENQFMVGPSILVAPISALQDFGQVFLPPRGADSWYYLFTSDRWPAGEPVAKAPLEFLPVFVAAGAILPMRSLVQHEGQADDGILTLHAYKGSAPSSFDFYWDEGDGYGYKTDIYHRRHIHQDPIANTLTLAETSGSMPLPWHMLRVLLHGYNRPTNAALDGNKVPILETMYSFTDALPDFDPFGNDTTAYSCHVQVLEVPYSAAAMLFTFS